MRDRLQDYLTRKQRKRMEEDPAFREEFLNADWGKNFKHSVATFTLLTLFSWLINGYKWPTTYLLFFVALSGGLYGLAWIYEWNWRRRNSK